MSIALGFSVLWELIRVNHKGAGPVRHDKVRYRQCHNVDEFLPPVSRTILRGYSQFAIETGHMLHPAREVNHSAPCEALGCNV